MLTRPRTTGALLTGFILLSLNTRVPFGQIGPLAPSAGFDSGVVTVLGMIPPLGMGLAAPVVPLLLRRAGEDRLLLWASTAALIGAIGRSLGLSGLIVGTGMTALAIGVVNVLIPVYVRRRFPGPRSGPIFGAYALAMGMGSALAAAVAVPVAEATGSWEGAIATAVVPGALGVLGAVLMLDRQQGEPTSRTSSETVGDVLTDEPIDEQFATEVRAARTWLAWSLLSFFGIQTLLFYGLLAWLPSILVAGGSSPATAATGQTILILGIAFGGFAAPFLAARRPSQSGTVAAVIVLCALGTLGLAFASAIAVFTWVPLLGLGLGGGQALPAVLYARRGTSAEHTAALSAFAQTGGFLVAALGPVLMSVGYESSGSWTVPLGALALLSAANLALSSRGARDRPRRSPERTSLNAASSADAR